MYLARSQEEKRILFYRMGNRIYGVQQLAFPDPVNGIEIVPVRNIVIGKEAIAQFAQAGHYKLGICMCIFR
jgi:hypothetical protein